MLLSPASVFWSYSQPPNVLKTTLGVETCSICMPLLLSSLFKRLVFGWINSLIQLSCTSLHARQSGGVWKQVERVGSIQMVSGCQDSELLLFFNRKLQMSYKIMLSGWNIQASVDLYSLATCLKKNSPHLLDSYTNYPNNLSIFYCNVKCWICFCRKNNRNNRNNIWYRKGCLWKKDITF